jgi:hypothetical protein
MASPSIVSCPAGAWTKVADNVTAGVVYVFSNEPQYLHTWRDHGDPAPTLITEGVGMNEGIEGNRIEMDRAIDVYVWCVGAAGSVRVDV